jgi:hypothetical protein
MAARARDTIASFSHFARDSAVKSKCAGCFFFYLTVFLQVTMQDISKLPDIFVRF